MTATDTEWLTRAACHDKDPELFYPPPGGDFASALAVCAACPVRAARLRDAFATHDLQWGIRAGLTSRERLNLHRRWKKGGEPDPVHLNEKRRSTLDLLSLTPRQLHRLYDRLVPDGTCLLWTGPVDNRGRGQLVVERERRRYYPPTHRVVFAQHHRRLPVGVVEQTCGNLLCCAPAHLLDNVLRVERYGDARVERRAA